MRTDRCGRVTRVFAWSQVEQLRYTGRSAHPAWDGYPQMVANQDEYDLRLRDGGQATVTIVYGFGPAMQPGARMSTAVMTGVAFAPWPALRATIDSGGTVTFGSVTVDLDGITVTRGPDIVYRRPWGVVDRVSLDVQAARPWRPPTPIWTFAAARTTTTEPAPGPSQPLCCTTSVHFSSSPPR